jgi:hypothetical protein
MGADNRFLSVSQAIFVGIATIPYSDYLRAFSAGW